MVNVIPAQPETYCFDVVNNSQGGAFKYNRLPVLAWIVESDEEDELPIPVTFAGPSPDCEFVEWSLPTHHEDGVTTKQERYYSRDTGKHYSDWARIREERKVAVAPKPPGDAS